MKITRFGRVTLYDLESTTDDFGQAVLDGLQQSQKTLPCQLFYDQRGCQLFEAICELDEYYLTRTEIGLLRRHITDIVSHIGPNSRLLEPGSGSGTKTRIVLDHLEHPVDYVPIDIARSQLVDTAMTLAEAYPSLKIRAVCADFMGQVAIPEPAIRPANTVAFFPGSTIGNLEPVAAQSFLGRMAHWCSQGGRLLIGVDLKKDRATLEAAYNDGRGVTAQFNLNLLVRINRELGADFALDGFRHRAVYNSEYGRIEMQLVSLRRQTVRVLGHEIAFNRAETITTEYCYKYDVEEFQRLAAGAGLSAIRVWTDDRRLFSVQCLVVE
jgi:dimethylhistidine N-methyltransferase